MRAIATLRRVRVEPPSAARGADGRPWTASCGRIPPFPMPFIIFCICRKFLSRRLMSDTWTPDPAAIRRFRDPSMFFGKRRSPGVIEQMIAIWRRTSFSLPCGSLAGPRRKLRRQLVHQGRHAAHALQAACSCAAQVLEVEILAACNLARELLGLVAIDLAGHLLDERQHVAHAENPRRHALGLEGLERVRLLADADEQDRLTRSRCAPTALRRRAHRRRPWSARRR